MSKHHTILTLISLCCLPLMSSCQNNNVEASNSNPTILECTQENGEWVTIAKRGTVKSAPLLVWNTTEFGDNYTPSERCKLVSQKLTTLVIANGGKLQNLNLKPGKVNNYAVICAVKTDENCNQDNMVLTLNQNNRQKSDDVLAKFENFANNQKTSPIYENGDSSKPMISIKIPDLNVGGGW